VVCLAVEENEREEMPKKQDQKLPPPKLVKPAEEVAQILQGQIDSGRDLLEEEIDSLTALSQALGRFRPWSEGNKHYLALLFDNSSKLDDYEKPLQRPPVFIVGDPAERSLTEQVKGYKDWLSQLVLRLESTLQYVQTIARLEKVNQPGLAVSPNAGYRSHRLVGRRVFVVHGHDDAAKLAVARFLVTLDLEPIILNEQPNLSRTIIEKFEDYSDVQYAVVLLTPDDIGYAKSEPKNKKPRARQNVIFELGYFIARLGRRNVCALHKGNVEILSDFQGVAWEPMDEHDGWHNKLIREMRGVGIEIDANKLIPGGS
jgi:predicted nucleotide-binding protein